MIYVYVVAALVLSISSIALSVGSLFMSTHTRWVYARQIPAIRAGEPAPPMPWSVRLGARLAKQPTD